MRWWWTGSSRGARTERGFALLGALFLAVLFFGLIAIALQEVLSASRDAQRFRARVFSQVLAENGAELAARDMINGSSTRVSDSSPQGDAAGELTRGPGERFRIDAAGISAGTVKIETRVRLEGRIEGSSIVIERASAR